MPPAIDPIQSTAVKDLVPVITTGGGTVIVS
jgi:hypothetical protein